MPLAQSPWDLEVAPLHVPPLPVIGAVDNLLLLHDVAAVVPCRFLCTPLDSGQLSLRSRHQFLLDTWSR